MKRTVLLSALLVFILLSGCSSPAFSETGGSSEAHVSSGSSGASLFPAESSSAQLFGEKYDYIAPRFTAYRHSLNSPYAAAVTGGALFETYREYFYSDTSQFAGNGNYGEISWVGLYDEESNSLTPLCFAPACTHMANGKDEMCFAQGFYGRLPSSFGISDGQIFALCDDLTVSYYSLDGVFLSSTAYARNKDFRISGRDSIFRAGDDIFIFLYPSGENSFETLFKHLIRYSVSQKQFYDVCDIVLDAPAILSAFDTLGDDYLISTADGLYTLDISDGSMSLFRDYLEAYTAISLFSGQTDFDEISFNFWLNKISVRWLSKDYTTRCCYTYDFETRAVTESADDHYEFRSTKREYFSYDGRTVIRTALSSSDPDAYKSHFALMDVDTGEVLDMRYSYGDAERRLNSLIAETEHGFIFQAHLRENQHADIGRLVWISKEDYFSGNWGNYREINMIY